MTWSEILFLIKIFVKNSLSSLLSTKLQSIFKNFVLSKLGVNVDLCYPSSNIFFSNPNRSIKFLSNSNFQFSLIAIKIAYLFTFIAI